MIDILSMAIGIGVFVAGMITPVLLAEGKERLLASRLKKTYDEEMDVERYSKGFEEGYKEAMYEVESNKAVKASEMPVEPSYFVSKGFEEDEWINSSPTPPQADTGLFEAYTPTLFEAEQCGTEIMTDSMEEQLYKRAIMR